MFVETFPNPLVKSAHMNFRECGTFIFAPNCFFFFRNQAFFVLRLEPTVQCVDLGEVVQEDGVRKLVPVEDAVDVLVIDSDPLAEVLVADLEPGQERR